MLDEGKGLSTEAQQYDIRSLINELRVQVDRWRQLRNPNDWRVTPETRRLLQHWRTHTFSGIRPFFCQIEAVETVIWLTEVAPELGKDGRKFLDHLNAVSREANPELLRLALKLATGAGKTTVMAMIIAWQTINAVRHPSSKRFTRGFLLVTPGITIRDRLQVLQPNDPYAYYAERELVPSDMVAELLKAKIVITNYHAFKLRERLEISKGGRALLQGRGPALQTLETEGQMLQRVIPELMGMKQILVLNDEAHHCYREKPPSEEELALKGDERKEAEANKEAARMWISGLEAVNRKLGLARVLDLSATPFFLSGSGYVEGTLFPWTMSDFSLMDAIECGIVKLPRVPVADNIPEAKVPIYRELWSHIAPKMPKKGRGKGGELDPLLIPTELQTALEALYGHYAKTFSEWADTPGVDVPPCFIVVCNNTATSKLVYDYISGFHRTLGDDSTQLEQGRLALFRNFDEHGNAYARPRTLLIDSEQLESGDALEDQELIDFRAFPRRVEVEFPSAKLFRPWPVTNGGERVNQMDPVSFRGLLVKPPKGRVWSHTSRTSGSALSGMNRLLVADRLLLSKTALDFKRYLADFPYKSISNWWDGFGGASDQVYVVQTNERVVERCLLLATDPGDLVLDPTCGSGTTATVAEQWGRRWITMDTSRVALALSRARIMGSRYPSFLLADSREGQMKEGEASRNIPSSQPTFGNVRSGFVYRRSAYITSGAIANNAEIDVIWETWQATLEPLRATLNTSLKQQWEEWEIPRDADAKWQSSARDTHAKWWEARIARQREIDASIAAKADTEYLFDKPYEDKRKVRVAGPFTVESLSPHRMLGVDEHDEIIDRVMERKTGYAVVRDFPSMILENLKTAGVQQAAKADKIEFTSLTPWPGDLVCADGRYMEAGVEKRAAIFIGPEFGTVSRPDLVQAARESADSRFDVLIACAFNFEAHATEFAKLGKVPVLKARMNADLHMAEDLKQTNKANLFVVFGEPDITIIPAERGRVRVKVNGVDVFDPSTGTVRSDGADGIACWFIDTDYNEESFFVRHAYFLGANDPYKALKTTLKAEVNQEAWETLHSDTSRAFDKPKSGRIAVKVINHLGDEVMKVFRV